MRNKLFHNGSENKVQNESESIFYYEQNFDAHEKKHAFIKKLSPLFLLLFILPVVFIYLLRTTTLNGIYFKLGVVLFLEISSWIMNLWIGRSLRNNNIILIWLIELPLVFLIFFALYLSF